MTLKLPLVAFQYDGADMAWAQDQENKPVIRCTCGQWVRINLKQVDFDGNYPFRHYADCGISEEVHLERFSRNSAAGVNPADEPSRTEAR